MKVILFMAISANGIIARLDYREDFLSRQNWGSFLDCVRETGALIWGRKTHEKFRAYGPQYLRLLASSSNIIVSGNPAIRPTSPMSPDSKSLPRRRKRATSLVGDCRLSPRRDIMRTVMDLTPF